MDVNNDENISEQLKREIIQDFAPITPIIFTALETAQSVVPDCINLIVKKCKIDNEFLKQICRYLEPSLMRAILQLLLKSKNIKTLAVFEDKAKSFDEDWDRLILCNNGLAGNYADRKYRLIKAIKSDILEKKLPPPGQSKIKQAYYSNIHVNQGIFQFFPNDICAKQKHNSIYLWDKSPSNSILLYLACPKWGRGNRVSTYFVEPIEHPLFLLQAPAIEPEDIVNDIPLEKLQTDLDNIINPEINPQTENIHDGDLSDDSEQDDLRQ
jgi:hypothetical protein